MRLGAVRGAFATLVLPVLLLVGPIIAAAKCAEGDNSRYYKVRSRQPASYP